MFFKATARSQTWVFVFAFVCVAFFIFANYYFPTKSEGISLAEPPPTKRNDLDRIWKYKLNLTGTFIKLTDKEINLFNKLQSIQVKFNFNSIRREIYSFCPEQIRHSIDCVMKGLNP